MEVEVILATGGGIIEELVGIGTADITLLLTDMAGLEKIR